MVHPAVASETDATAGYIRAMEYMHKAMPDTYTGDVDTDFVAGMIPHHQAAVDMALVELQYGKDPKIRQLAKNILFMQQIEIANFKRWLDRRGYLLTDPDSPANAEYKKSSDIMHHAMMNVAYTGDPDIDFVLGMIPHHQGAVDMAVTQLKYGRTRQISSMAESIARSQTQEIMLMQNWLAKQTITPKKTAPTHDHHASH